MANSSDEERLHLMNYSKLLRANATGTSLNGVAAAKFSPTDLQVAHEALNSLHWDGGWQASAPVVLEVLQ
jgi:hypothetical protein